MSDWMSSDEHNSENDRSLTVTPRTSESNTLIGDASGQSLVCCSEMYSDVCLRFVGFLLFI